MSIARRISVSLRGGLCLLVLALTSTLVVLSAPQAASASTPYSAPWNPALNGSFPPGSNTPIGDTWDYTMPGALAAAEWGIDITLPAGTPVFAPVTGTVFAYEPCHTGTCWNPGRLVFRPDSGGTIGFGHVTDVVPAGTRVAAGTEIATIGPTPSYDGGNHVEFMSSPSSSAVYGQSNFTSYGKADPRSPFQVLKAYMSGGASQAQPEVAFQANTSSLWSVGADGHGPWNLGMMAGTSPSIARLTNGGYEVAFQANT